MRWVLHGNLTPAVTDALVRHEQKPSAVAELGLAPEASAFEFFKVAQSKQLDVITTDAALVNAIFDEFDVLVMPVMGGTALPVRRWEGKGALQTVLGMSRFYPYCVPWNHLGNPAMAVPAGFSPEGMPLSIQVIARHGEEAKLLSLAAQIEAERPWADARPAIS